MATQAQRWFDFTGDVTAKRHGGNAESDAAYERVKWTKVQAWNELEAFAESRGPHGITLRDACDRFDKEPNCVSGRLSELKSMGRLVKRGDRRDDCAVLLHPKFAGERQ